MSARYRTAIAVWRAWHGTQHATLGALGVAVLHLWSGPIEVPGRDDVAQMVWPLAPTLLALACLTGSRTAMGPSERITPRGAAAVRAGYLLALGCFGASLLVASGPIADARVVARNDAFLCGLALLAAEVLPASAAWVPVVVVPMAMWLLGSNGLGSAPEPWAVLLEPAGSTAAARVASGTLLAGAGCYLARPGFTEVQRTLLRRRGPDRRVSGARSGR